MFGSLCGFDWLELEHYVCYAIKFELKIFFAEVFHEQL